MRPLAARSLDRLRAIQQRRPWLADAVIVLGLLALLVPPSDAEPAGATRAFTAAMVLPLLVRRRWPVQVFTLLAAIALGQWLADIRAPGDAALLVALYSVAVSQSRRVTALAFTVLEVGVIMATVRWGTAGDDVGVRAFVGLTGLAVAAAVMGTSTRDRRALVASLQDRAQRLEHERDQQGQLAAAAERARIAREMHDIVAHNVSVMIALADGASYVTTDEPERAQQAMRSVSRTGRQALAEMRRLLGVLRDDDAETARAPQPGLAELDALVAQLRAAGLPVGYEMSGHAPEALPAGLQLAVYRIVQEALTNTLKHAGAGATAELAVAHHDGELEVRIRDTGTTQAAPTSHAGAGLRGMRERAAVYDGTIEAGPLVGGGWQVRLKVPVPARPALVTA